MQPSFPQEVIDLIIDEVVPTHWRTVRNEEFRSPVWKHLHFCSLTSRSFRRRSQYHLFSTFIVDVRYRYLPFSRTAGGVSRLPEMYTFLEQSPHICSYIKVLRLVLDSGLTVQTIPSCISDVLKLLARRKKGHSAIRTLELRCRDDLWTSANEDLISALFGLIIGEPCDLDDRCSSIGTRQGIKNIVLYWSVFPLEFFKFCSGLERVELMNCRPHMKRLSWPRVMGKETYIHASPPPNITSLSCEYQHISFAFVMKYLERNSLVDLLTGLNSLEFAIRSAVTGKADFAAFWRSVALNARGLESLAIDTRDLEEVDDLSIYISDIPRLRVLRLSFQLDRVDYYRGPYTWMPLIFQLTKPSPHDDSLISVEELDIDIVIHTNPEISLEDVMGNHERWGELDALLAGPRYHALRKVEIQISVDYAHYMFGHNDSDYSSSSTANPEPMPLSAKDITSLDNFAGQFKMLSSSSNITFSFRRPCNIIVL